MVKADDPRAAAAHREFVRLAREEGAPDTSLRGAVPGEEPREANDPIERWGRIIGRALGWSIAPVLAWQLLRGVGF